MANTYFQFKQFTVRQDRCAMKVTTDACLFGAWVTRQLLQQNRPAGNLLDIGTGTGLLSLMVAQKNSGNIEAVEIESAAAGQAGENFAASSWSSRLRAIHTDILRWQTEVKYDCIFSNPPFYENDLVSEKGAKNIAHHDQGLKLRELFSFLQNHLTDKGSFFLLLPAKREKEIDSLLESNALILQQKVSVKQTLKHDPFRIMIQGRREKVETLPEQTIVIKDEAGTYTPAFTNLLKDYYLYL